MVKVFDGIVLAADSATTMTLQNGSSQVYTNANKVFQLHRHRPIGAAVWGMGNIGAASIATLAKDLRARLMGRDPDFLNWDITSSDYTVEGVADRVVEMFFDELYVNLPTGQHGEFGILIAGYSNGSKQPEAWLVNIDDPLTRPTPKIEAPYDSWGWASYAQPYATQRLFNGYDDSLSYELEQVLEPDQWLRARTVLQSKVTVPAQPAMPFADAINLARFLVDVTVGYSRFQLGPDTVGGPVEVAGISRHEGFKWISRKHYYSADVNRPEEPFHAR